MSLGQFVPENKVVIKDSQCHVKGYGSLRKGLPLVKPRATWVLEKRWLIVYNKLNCKNHEFTIIQKGGKMA